ncbi:MAG: hypothetical protein OXE96_07740 [Gemmatimonadetes bacterium]|nr:hypothetical protein [Gemmatimonadota bacterium]
MKYATMKRTLNVAMLLALANATMLGGRPIPDTATGSHTVQAVQVIDSEDVIVGGGWKAWLVCVACVGAGIAVPVVGPLVVGFACGFACGYAVAEA